MLCSTLALCSSCSISTLCSPALPFALQELSLPRLLAACLLRRNFYPTIHKAKATTPATPANIAPLLKIFATAPPVGEADAEAAVPDAVDEPVALETAEVDAAAEVELAEPPETGLGVGLPAASSKLAHASRVLFWAWMTMLRLPKKELTPGSVER
jgi:hypothetical protein